jgi:hypothetical protein
MEVCISSGALRTGGDVGDGSSGLGPVPLVPLRDPRVAILQAEETGSTASHNSGGFSGTHFWTALRSSGLEQEVTQLRVPL